MWKLVSALVAAICTIILIGAAGFLEIRSEAAEIGVVVAWDSVPTAITGGRSPWLTRLLVALLTGTAFYLLWPGRKRPRVISWILPMVAAILAGGFSIWYVLSTPFPFDGAVESALHSASTVGKGLDSVTGVIVESPLMSWLRAGSLSPAIHVFAAASFTLTVIGYKRAKHEEAE